jgi:hypothetical protein
LASQRTQSVLITNTMTSVSPVHHVLARTVFMRNRHVPLSFWDSTASNLT